MQKGKCAKQTTRCIIVTESGEKIIGENWCESPQIECPRVIKKCNTGEGYELCKVICNQIGHAEQVAIKIAGDKAQGSTAYLEGHTYFCMDCQHALFNAGVKFLTIGRPSDFYADEVGL